MKRALIILVPLLAVIAGAIIGAMNAGSRSTNLRGDWSGHVVPFYLPVDAGISLAGPKGPPKAIVGVSKDGALTFNEQPLPAPDDGGVAEVKTRVGKAVAAGTKKFELEFASTVDAGVAIRLMSAMLDGGAGRPEIMISPDDPEPASPKAGGPVAGFTPPKPPVATPVKQRTIPENKVVILFLDGLQKRVVLRMQGHPDEQVGQARLYERLKALAKAHASPERPHQSDCIVLVHAGPETTWSQFSFALMECAKVGIWRIEAVVAPGE